VDVNVNTLKDAGESNYIGAATFQLNTGTTMNAVNGAFTFPQLLAGTYSVNYTNPPTGAGGYSITYPINGPPPSLTVTVGRGTCNPGDAGTHGASCDANGSVINLNFGITNNKPWFQCNGADCRIDPTPGFTSKVPSTAIGGAFASKNGTGGTPGLIFTGNSTPDFGQGQASSTGWVVGGATYGETYTPTRVGGIVKTSYNFLQSKATQGNITPTDIAPFCSGGIANCTLSALPHGVYVANGSLRLVGGGYNFGLSQNYVILVNGDLTISERIAVPNGSTALFSTTGDIRVDKALGETFSDGTTITIQGIYSAGKSFIADGNNNCTTGADPRLNIAGSVIVNGAQGGGSFQNLRDLCGNDPYYPSVAFFERPDFIINTPDFLKQPNFTYQEIAP